MNFFSEFLTDPDKKFNDSDKDLIKTITEGLFKSDPKIRLIEQDHDTGALESNYNDRIVSFFEKGEKKFHIEFLKVSESKKKDFIYLDQIVAGYCECMGYDGILELKKKAKKLVGIIVIIHPGRHETNFAVGSLDDPSTFNKLHDHAIKEITRGTITIEEFSRGQSKIYGPNIINWVINNLKK